MNNTNTTALEIAERFNVLAQQEKWFDIQDELFSDNVKSIEPVNSPYLGNASGKKPVRLKGEEWVKRITGVNRLFTSEPVVSGNHFAVAREIDVVVDGHGRVQINQMMLYEVSEGKIVLEQFFY